MLENRGFFLLFEYIFKNVNKINVYIYIIVTYNLYLILVTIIIVKIRSNVYMCTHDCTVITNRKCLDDENVIWQKIILIKRYYASNYIQYIHYIYYGSCFVMNCL